MNLKQLETFYWINRAGGFRAAAERLHTTQSGVSMRILRLEEEFGAKLFHRASGPLRLTRRGRAVMELAERAVALSRDFHAIAGTAEQLGGSIKVSVAEIIAVTWLPKLMGVLKREFPRLTVAIDTNFTRSMRRKLDTEDTDLILVAGPVDLPDVRTEYLGRITYRWIASRSLELPDRALSVSEIATLPILTLPEDSILNITSRRWFASARIDPEATFVCNSLSLLTALVRAGLGISLLPVDCEGCEDVGRDSSLQVLETTQPIPPIEYYAAFASTGDDIVIEQVARIAREVSTFPGAAVNET